MTKMVPGGWAGLREANHDLVVRARQLLCRELKVDAPCPENLLAAMATVPLPERLQGGAKFSKIEPEQLRLYDEFGIEVPFFRIGKPQRRYFRISAQIYNRLAEYEYLGKALQTLS
jgi:isopenicillin-N epimerase